MLKRLSNLCVFTKLSVIFFTFLVLMVGTSNVAAQVRKAEAVMRFQEGFADVVKDLLPVTVTISTALEEERNLNASLLDQIMSDSKRGVESSIASGVLVSSDGYIATNYHVVEGAEKITVKLDDGAKYNAEIIGIDKKTDLALIKIEVAKPLPFAKFSTVDKSAIGDWAIIVGNPFGLGKSVSLGIISAKSRSVNNGQVEEFIQTDAAINTGNSGGPMFNIRGEVIGINTAIFSPGGGSVGIGFAIPATTVSLVIKQLRERGEVERGSLGISVKEVNDDISSALRIEKGRGVFVVDVIENEAAAKAGIVAGDVILQFNDQEINDLTTLPQLVANYPIGKSARIVILRSGRMKSVSAVITKLRSSDSATKKMANITKGQPVLLGMSLVEIDDKLRKLRNISPRVNGLLVTNVSARSEAAERGVMVGDVIVLANQMQVESVAILKVMVDEAKKSGAKMPLLLKRGDVSVNVVLNVAR